MWQSVKLHVFGDRTIGRHFFDGQKGGAAQLMLINMIPMKTKSLFALLLFVLLAFNLNAQSTKEYDLFVAANNGDTNAISSLVADGVNPNIINQYGNTPLYLVAINNSASSINLLSDLGAFMNTSNNSGNTTLAISTIYGHHEVVEALLSSSADQSLVAKARGFFFLIKV